jgi:hypothetical protein
VGSTPAKPTNFMTPVKTEKVTQIPKHKVKDVVERFLVNGASHMVIRWESGDLFSVETEIECKYERIK